MLNLQNIFVVAVQTFQSAFNIRQAGCSHPVVPGAIRRHEDGQDFLVVRLRLFTPLFLVERTHPQRQRQRRMAAGSAAYRAVYSAGFLQYALLRLLG